MCHDNSNILINNLVSVPLLVQYIQRLVRMSFSFCWQGKDYATHSSRALDTLPERVHISTGTAENCGKASTGPTAAQH